MRIRSFSLFLALLLSGCSLFGRATGPADPAQTATGSYPGIFAGLNGQGLQPYLEQRIQWSGCARGSGQCASVLVPLDYELPQDRAIRLALRRTSATANPKLGTIFVNPGGPGAAGQHLATSFSTKGLEMFDIVGWDPRGTGESAGLNCLDRSTADAYLALDASPDSSAELADLIAGANEFAQACHDIAGDLLTHVSTEDTARDLEILRQLAGGGQLNYFGYSYGTYLGAVYADLYPGSVGKMVLDSAVDITGTNETIQAQGFDTALRNYALWCAARACGLGVSESEVTASITSLWDRLDVASLAVQDRQLTQSLAVTGVAQFLYGRQDAWPALTNAVAKALAGDGQPLLRAADALNGRRSTGYSEMFSAFPAISCADAAPVTLAQAEERWLIDQQKAPIFGKYLGPQVICPVWPVHNDQVRIPTAIGAPPIVVIGATGDSAAPYQSAVDMARQLESGILVTFEGTGHGHYGGKSACVDALVVTYFAQGEVPEAGQRCAS